MASAGPVKGTNRGYATRSYFTSRGGDAHGSAFRSAVLSGRFHSNQFPTTTTSISISISSISISSISSIRSISNNNPLSILPKAVLPLVARPTSLSSHAPSSPLLSRFLPVAHCRAETASDQTFQPWSHQASRTGSGTGPRKEQSNGKGSKASGTASAASDDEDARARADISKTANIITERVDGKLYTVKLRSLYSAFCPRGMLIMAVRNSLIQILPLFADYIEAQAPSLEEEEEEDEEEEEARRERERRRAAEAAERERKIAAFRNMGAGRIAAGTAWLSLREMAVISVRRALEHFYLARTVSARWLWKLTKDPTQSAIRKVGRGLTGSPLIKSVTITNVRAHFLSPLSSVAVQLITDTFTAFHRLLFPPPPPQAGQGLAISPVRATGVQIVWLVKRTLSYSLKLVFSTASGALLSAVCVRYVGPWTTSYAYILGDMLVYQTASTLIDPLLFSATT
ncbi:unnamed protein product [Closterium sp. NIES-65]|nr:unnamed protein product [Closterium sp. NIES-65]